jgi:hypothetical protein
MQAQHHQNPLQAHHHHHIIIASSSHHHRSIRPRYKYA